MKYHFIRFLGHFLINGRDLHFPVLQGKKEKWNTSIQSGKQKGILESGTHKLHKHELRNT